MITIEHDQTIKNLLLEQKKIRNNKLKESIKNDCLVLKPFQPKMFVKAVIIKNNLMDPSTFEGDVQCRISIEEENFSYNFKHKGPNNYQFKNVGENMSVKIEIFDANERIERVVDLVNIIAKKESYNTTFNLQNINKQYRGSFLLRFDVIKQE